jgi:hypothetical protein
LLFALLALGSYESSVLLPVAVVLVEILVLRSALRRIAGVVATGLGLVVAYLMVRRLVVGATVGGYAEFLDVFLGPLSSLLNQVGRAISLLFWPRYEPAITPASGWLALAGLGLAAVLAGVLFLRSRQWRAESGLVAFSILFAVASMAPFAYRLVSPAEGRYFYLSAAGLAFGFGAVVRVVLRLSDRWAAPLALVLVAAPLAYTPMLSAHLGWMSLAAAESTRVANAITEVSRELAPGSRLFVADVPRFVTNQRGVNLAQIHHYGLRDRAMAPFSDQSMDVYPLLGPSRPAALALSDFGVVLRWLEGSLLPVTRTRQLPFDGIRVLGWNQDPKLPGLRLLVSPELRDSRFEMIVVSGGNPLRRVFEPDFAGAVETSPDFLETMGPYPFDFLDMMSTLYPGGEFFVWVEARNDESRLLGLSPAIGFRLPLGG